MAIFRPGFWQSTTKFFLLASSWWRWHSVFFFGKVERKYCLRWLFIIFLDQFWFIYLENPKHFLIKSEDNNSWKIISSISQNAFLLHLKLFRIFCIDMPITCFDDFVETMCKCTSGELISTLKRANCITLLTVKFRGSAEMETKHDISVWCYVLVKVSPFWSGTFRKILDHEQNSVYFIAWSHLILIVCVLKEPNKNRELYCFAIKP